MTEELKRRIDKDNHTVKWNKTLCNKLTNASSFGNTASTKRNPVSIEKPSTAKKRQLSVGKRNRPAVEEESSTVTLNPTVQRKGPTKSGKHVGFMCPSGISLEHPMAELLLSQWEEGCKVDCGPDWSQEQTEAAMRRGTHMRQSDAAAA